MTMKLLKTAVVTILVFGIDRIEAFSAVCNKKNVFTSRSSCATTTTTTTTTTSLSMVNESDEFMKWAKASRSASADDTVVELMKPLGIVLNQDDRGNVYVETVAPQGNAARSGKVKEGDFVTMCSATFGNEMWSTRGVGLTRVLSAIKVRSGNSVKLVLESPKQSKKKQTVTLQQIKAREEAARVAQAKKDQLLTELETDEKILNPKKFFGLF